MILHIKNKRFF